MSLTFALSEHERQSLGPRTCAYLNLPHSHNDNYRLSWLVCYVLAERDKNPTPLPDAWQAGTLALLLGNVLDHHKAGKLTDSRAEQYRTEARTATSPGKLLRLLVTLHHETNPA